MMQTILAKAEEALRALFESDEDEANANETEDFEMRDEENRTIIEPCW